MSRFRAASGRSLRSLKVRPFRNYFIGQTLSIIGTGIQVMALTWLVLKLTNSASQLGIMIALQTVPLLILGGWAGNIADRVDNRRVLVAVSIAAGAMAAALGVLTWSGNVDLVWIRVIAVLLGIVQTFERPAAQAMLYELVGPDDLPSAIGLNSTLNATSRLIGPAIAGVLIATVGIEACFFANAVSFLAVIVAISRLRSDQLLPRRGDHTNVRIRDGLTYAWHQPTLRRALIAMAFVGALSYNFQQIVPSMVRFVFHSGPGALGIVQALSAVGSIAGGMIVASIIHPRCRHVGITGVVFGVFILLTAIAPTLVVFTVIWIPAGLGAGLHTAATLALLQHETAPEYQGRIMALFNMALIGTSPIGALLIGAVIDHWSARAAAVISGTTALLVAAYMFAERAPATTGEPGPRRPSLLHE